ncbi:uncharacterized protein Z519_06874 [Cladophialophora bantiana CBS 173.52]|uniref:Piwi domain-containing protein n=1 Tax=Cladophialophora bantiana (strain ATCC 10958 / CBS 173.52 / CDC B-1940 / NIH 8579) TaxID=1442370 RepID=A0A0D2HQF7_CLAB1|nr:uncharacterized protein Z519_06874 [Cladophialophora bantiana CBS 173.52]KIW93025.1 hypothetical protein Z519_06874 [Cladophialophora bantiana CBS 173.52]
MASPEGEAWVEVGLFAVAEVVVVPAKERAQMLRLSSRKKPLPWPEAFQDEELTALSTRSHSPGDVPQLNVEVEKLEGEIEHHVLRSSRPDPSLPIRPGFGTEGRKVLLYANYMHLDWGNVVLYRYSLSFSTDMATGKSIKAKDQEQVVLLLLAQNFSQNRSSIVTDFKSLIISKTKLNPSRQGYIVTYMMQGEDAPYPKAKKYRVGVTLEGTNTVSELIAYLTSTRADEVLSSKETIIQALNIVIGHNLKATSQIASVASNQHYPKNPPPSEKFDLGVGLTAIRGFFVSVRAATGRILVNVQVKHSPFYNAGPLVRLVEDFGAATGFDRNKLDKFLEGLTVHPSHTARKNKAGQLVPRPKVINGLATKGDGRKLPHRPIVPEFGAGADRIQFWLDAEKRYVTVLSFFQQTYSITLKYPRMPILNVGNQEHPVYLPAEVCQIPPGQAFKRQLSRDQTKNISRFAVRTPVYNAQSIVREGVAILNFGQSANPTHNTFNLNLKPRLITVPGRVLGSPNVNYGNKKTVATRSGSWNMQNTQFVSNVNVDKWTWLFIKTKNYKGPLSNRQDLEAAVREFASALCKVGIRCTNCSPGQEITVQFGTGKEISTVNEEVDKAIHKISSTFFSTSAAAQKQLVLIILASDKPELYNRVKVNCDVREGINNVCVLASTFAKRNPHVFANMALKVNLKLGGVNQSLNPSKLGIAAGGKTMFVGLDVTHPSVGSLDVAPSVVGMVSSIDQLLGQWRASVVIQERRKEMVSGLKELMKKHLGLWRQHNKGLLPDHIVVYRDGVSEGQYQVVLGEERPLIQAACAEVYPANATKEKLPRLNITIVSKRHHTRFYPTKDNEADSSKNPFNGTVVDRGVTEARGWDFWMQAHATIQGTARPIHYFVVYDEVFRHDQQRQATKPTGPQFTNAADALEDLTHNMCYLFGRCTRAVSLCPPAYYADLVCDRARLYLSEVFEPSSEKESPPISQNMVTTHPRVANSMFFI